MPYRRSCHPVSGSTRSTATSLRPRAHYSLERAGQARVHQKLGRPDDYESQNDVLGAALHDCASVQPGPAARHAVRANSTRADRSRARRARTRCTACGIARPCPGGARIARDRCYLDSESPSIARPSPHRTQHRLEETGPNFIAAARSRTCARHRSRRTGTSGTKLGADPARSQRRRR